MGDRSRREIRPPASREFDALPTFPRGSLTSVPAVTGGSSAASAAFPCGPALRTGHTPPSLPAEAPIPSNSPQPASSFLLTNPSLAGASLGPHPTSGIAGSGIAGGDALVLRGLDSTREDKAGGADVSESVRLFRPPFLDGVLFCLKHPCDTFLPFASPPPLLYQEIDRNSVIQNFRRLRDNFGLALARLFFVLRMVAGPSPQFFVAIAFW